MRMGKQARKEAKVHPEPPLETDARCGCPRGPPRGAVLICYVCYALSDLTKRLCLQSHKVLERRSSKLFESRRYINKTAHLRAQGIEQALL